MRSLWGMIFLVIVSTQVSAVLQHVVGASAQSSPLVTIFSPQPIFQHHSILPSILPYSQVNHQPAMVRIPPTSFPYERTVQYQAGTPVPRTPVQILSPFDPTPAFYSAPVVPASQRTDIYGIAETGCTKIYGIVTSVIPPIIVQVLAVVLLFPQVITTQVTIWLNPFDNTDVLGIFIRCFFPSGIGREMFGENPTAAVADFDGTGSLYMAQMIARENTPAAITTIGRITGLTPGAQYSLSVHETTAKNDALTSCNDVGAKVQTLGTSNFVGSQKGDAIIVIMEERYSLSSILSRSIVISPVGGGQKRCAIVKKQKTLPQKKAILPQKKVISAATAHF